MSNSIKQLVDKLDSRLHASEHEFTQTIRITPEISNEDLDELFIALDFDKAALLQQLSVTNFDDSEMQEQFLKQVELATIRLKSYLDVLKEQIVSIVETQSEGFLDVASKLDGFRQILTDLKDSHSDFHANFVTEKSKADQVYNYLHEQYVSLQQMLQERKELKELVELQELYDEVQDRVTSLTNQSNREDYLQIEKTVRMWSNVKEKSRGCKGEDFVQQKLHMLHQYLLNKVCRSFQEFAYKSHFFSLPDVQVAVSEEEMEERAYFEQIEMSSYLRSFKILGSISILYALIQQHVLASQLDKVAREAYSEKSGALKLMKGETDFKLPLQVFLDGIQKHLLQKRLKAVIELTSDQENEDYVSGYKIFNDCLWPQVLETLDSQLSFVTTTGNLKLFHCNYKTVVEFIAIVSPLISTNNGNLLLQRFNLQTFSDFVVLEISDKLTQKLETAFQSLNKPTAPDEVYEEQGQLQPLASFTLELCSTTVSTQFYYLHECGDKLVKLSIQILIRHLNYIMEKVSERKSLQADKILFILEDLHQLQLGINTELMPQIVARIHESGLSNGHQVDQAIIREQFVQPLFEQVERRFDLISQPCISAISKKIQVKLAENVQCFRQVPSVFRMTSRELQNQPSQFMEYLLKPLSLLIQNQGFANLSDGLRNKVHENVINTALFNLESVITEVMCEETKVNESLLKFKKPQAENQADELSDFDKMRIQLILDLQDLSRQIITIYPNADISQVIEIQQEVKSIDFTKIQKQLDLLQS